MSYLSGPAAITNHVSITAEAYQRLRAMIVSGELGEGARLVVRPLSEALGISATPVKSALESLTNDGLVRASPRRGYYVVSLTVGDIREICELRSVLDGVAALNLANDVASHPGVIALNDSISGQQLAIEAGDFVGYADLNDAFHWQLWRLAGNGRMVDFGSKLMHQMRLLVNRSSRVPGRAARSIDEHRAIIDTIVAGDADGAQVLAAQHAHAAMDLLADGEQSGAAK